MSINPGDPQVKVKDLKVGMCVDLESCPHLKSKPTAEYEYAEVLEIKQESDTCIAVYYEGGMAAGYDPDQLLTTRRTTPERRV